MKKQMNMKTGRSFQAVSLMSLIMLLLLTIPGCSNGTDGGEKEGSALTASDAASKVYVAPGKKDEFYGFFSGGYNGQLSIYGLPSGRLFKIIPVFSQFPQNGYGYNTETKAMLMTSRGFIPWDDAHHPELSQTDGIDDGRWLFINANNTPRIARVSLKTFETSEIIEIPNCAGAHAAPFVTENTNYVICGTRFSIPIPEKDVPIDAKKFKGTLSFIHVDSVTGNMNLAFQILVPGFDYDLGHCGKGVSKDWTFFTTYNTEQASTLKEIEASQNDKDFVAAVNWKKAAEYVKEGKYKLWPAHYLDNRYDEGKQEAYSIKHDSVKVLIPADCPGMIYYIPTPKSPHGVNVDPSGEYIVASGKLSADIPVHSFSKMLKAIQNKEIVDSISGIPVLKFEAVNYGMVKRPGLGPLHTEFDGKGNAYTSMFISSEIVKWRLKDLKVLDRIPVYYSPGHLMIPGGDSRKPEGKYLVSLNKITKDRYLPTGPELCQSAQLIDISGDKMKILLDFPTTGEPHYAQAIPADKIIGENEKYYKLEDNKNPYVTPTEKDAKVVRKGNEVHIYMTAIRSHFTPDNIEGIKVGDKVYFHVTNVEQDWDIPHGFAVLGAQTSGNLIMPGETRTLVWYPKNPGIYPFYCTDFCSALHQEMQGYVRVSAADSNVPLRWRTGSDNPL